MRRSILTVLATLSFTLTPAQARTNEVVDLPMRPGVTQRVLLVAPEAPRAVALMLPGGHGGLGLFPNGSMRWGDANFVVRTREQFAAQGLIVAVVDAPSDRQQPPYLAEARQTPEHAEDIGRITEALRQRFGLPVWLVGTSRGTQSAAYAATQLKGSRAPDGVVLTASILVDERTRPIPAMPLNEIRQPVLVVHHEADACQVTPFAATAHLMRSLTAAPRKELLAFKGGISTGPVCAALAHHGFNGIETEVVGAIANWILAP